MVSMLLVSTQLIEIDREYPPMMEESAIERNKLERLGLKGSSPGLEGSSRGMDVFAGCDGFDG